MSKDDQTLLFYTLKYIVLMLYYIAMTQTKLPQVYDEAYDDTLGKLNKRLKE